MNYSLVSSYGLNLSLKHSTIISFIQNVNLNLIQGEFKNDPGIDFTSDNPLESRQYLLYIRFKEFYEILLIIFILN